jgi:two-component system OmpR family sensor kinase
MHSWSMSRRLIGALVVLIGGIWLVGVGIAAISIRHEIDEVFDSALQETAQRLLPLVLDDLDGPQDENDDEEEQQERERQLADPFPAEEHEEYLLYQVRNAQGHVLLRSHDAPPEPFPAPLKRGRFDTGGRRYFTEASPGRKFYVQVAEVPKARQEAITALWVSLMSPLLGLLPIAALVIYWTVGRATRPITDIQRQIAKRSGDNLESIDPHGLPIELTPIIQDMNRLLERLKAALDAERSFAANSAHELRNPVAAARAQAEIIVEALRGSPNQVRASQLVDMLGQLSKRIEKMLQLARTEAGLGYARPETDLVEVTRLVVGDYARRPKLADRLRFDPGDQDKLTVTIDPDALGIALQNLIDNAIAHGSPGTPIAVAVGPGTIVRVINEGPIVSESELSVLTKPFERGGVRRAPGAGLGLSIVKQIMRQADGDLELVSPAQGQRDGFEARLVFPPLRLQP